MKKKFLNNRNVKLDLFPVFVDHIGDGQVPLKVVGIRHKEVELHGDITDGKMDAWGSLWIPRYLAYTIKEKKIITPEFFAWEPETWEDQLNKAYANK